ncbi:uncharacterized protein CELE_K04G11.1 [Caenorhabditis elegans]|uniref:Secreted protein n=1 Tax=Caenorhabditis elegans TaxID=6239 RepID=Q93848_CAEEL|nr:Secreted protein [Caenorhabditis elegans]CAB01761.2 Secreted protein [Caenorhabditis elegans]
MFQISMKFQIPCYMGFQLFFSIQHVPSSKLLIHCHKNYMYTCMTTQTHGRCSIPRGKRKHKVVSADRIKREVLRNSTPPPPHLLRFYHMFAHAPTLVSSPAAGHQLFRAVSWK